MTDIEWIEDVNEAFLHYPKLDIEGDASNRIVSGLIEVIDKDENLVIDKYEVRFTYEKCFPKCLPRVWEIGGKIPQTEDRHLYSKDWNLCFMLPVDEAIYCSHGITSLRFIDQVLVPRLADEYNVSKGGKYRSELPHNYKKACWEFYRRKLETTDNEKILRILKPLVFRTLPKGYEKCVCGSHVKFKKCHRSILQTLQKAGIENAKALKVMTS